MDVRPLKIDGAYEFTPQQHGDRRGKLVVWYDEQDFSQALGYPLGLGQVNHAVSQRGTVRGVHFAQVPPGQAKYVYCPHGAVLDVVIDIRVGSPTFGQWDTVRLDQEDCRGVYLAEGLGHAYVALEDESILIYLCSERYNPAREFGVDPFDKQLDLPWPKDITPILSDRDMQAPTLREAQEAGLLPDYEACTNFYRQLGAANPVGR